MGSPDYFIKECRTRDEIFNCKTGKRFNYSQGRINTLLNVFAPLRKGELYIFDYNELTEEKFEKCKEESDLFLITSRDWWDSDYFGCTLNRRVIFRNFTKGNLRRTNFLALFQDENSQEPLRSHLGYLVFPKDKQFLCSEIGERRYNKIKESLDTEFRSVNREDIFERNDRDLENDAKVRLAEAEAEKWKAEARVMVARTDESGRPYFRIEASPPWDPARKEHVLFTDEEYEEF